MKDTDNLTIQGLVIQIATLTVEIQKLAARITAPSAVIIPEWVNLETAVKLKGGGALATYQTKLFLQPCCGLNYRKIAGRKCWRRDDVIRWLAITDADLKAYGDEWKVTIPENYKSKKEAA